MHEYGIASSLLESVLESAAKHGAKKVTAIRIRVGALRGVVPEHLAFFFEHLSEGTVAEGCDLQIEEEPIFIDCRRCGEFEVSEAVFTCPRCGGLEFNMKGGDALELKSMEIET